MVSESNMIGPARQYTVRRAAANAGRRAFPQGHFGGERPGAAGVTQERLPGRQNVSFAVGRSPTSPLYLFSVRGGGVLCWDLVDVEGLIGHWGVSSSVTGGVS